MFWFSIYSRPLPVFNLQKAPAAAALREVPDDPGILIRRNAATKMKIFVKTLKGTHFEIEVKPEDTVPIFLKIFSWLILCNCFFCISSYTVSNTREIRVFLADDIVHGLRIRAFLGVNFGAVEFMFWKVVCGESVIVDDEGFLGLHGSII